MDKAPDAFRTISEVADEIDVPQHVLRFWESRFQHIRPMKRGGGRRYYRPDDVDLLRGIRHLLYSEGYTIRGVQRILREQGAAFVQEVWRSGAAPPASDDKEPAAEAAPEPVAERRAEPSLFDLPPPQFGPSAPFADSRREPTIEPPSPQAVPAGSPSETDRPRPRPLAAEERHKLQTALDELLACRAVIDAALRRQ